MVPITKEMSTQAEAALVEAAREHAPQAPAPVLSPLRTRADTAAVLMVEVGPAFRPDPSGGGVSVVIPTRNEAPGIAELLGRLNNLPPGYVAEALFVDDSDDHTPGEILEHGRRGAFPVTLLHRKPSHRLDGLSGAVLAGFAEARSTWICVMDADLQHPPALIATLRDAAGDADVVCATRYRAGGSASSFSRLRHAVSFSSALAAKAIFPRRLHRVSDPLSGFFLVRAAALAGRPLRPTGFKILLEILVRNPDLTRTEVPYRFDVRHAGESKASAREGIRFLCHLIRLKRATKSVDI